MTKPVMSEPLTLKSGFMAMSPLDSLKNRPRHPIIQRVSAIGAMDERGPSSPCLNICTLDEQGVCRGCFRTLEEIADWIADEAGRPMGDGRARGARRLAAEKEQGRR